MQDESSRGYLFVAIDRATRWVYLEIFKSRTAKNAQKFLKNLLAKTPFKIRKILTDNGKEFTDRFTPNGEREPTGNHKFDKTCAKNHIEHRLIKPKHPQTNGMVERFNGRVSDILKTTHFDSSQDLAATLKRYLRLYNHHIPQKALGHTTPVQALKEWEKKKQKLFTKKVYKHARLDNYLFNRQNPRFALISGISKQILRDHTFLCFIRFSSIYIASTIRNEKSSIPPESQCACAHSSDSTWS